MDTDDSPRINVNFDVAIPENESTQRKPLSLKVEASGWVDGENTVVLDTLFALHVEQGEYLVLPKKSLLRTQLVRVSKKLMLDKVRKEHGSS